MPSAIRFALPYEHGCKPGGESWPQVIASLDIAEASPGWLQAMPVCIPADDLGYERPTFDKSQLALASARKSLAVCARALVAEPPPDSRDASADSSR